MQTCALLFAISLFQAFVLASTKCDNAIHNSGISAPNVNSTLYASRSYNVNWSLRCSGFRCLNPGEGLVYLSLQKYFAQPGNPRLGAPVCTNVTDTLLTVAYGVPNIGSYQWDLIIPPNITSDHNYIITGSIVDKETKRMTNLQSDLFTIKRNEDDIIPNDPPLTATTTATGALPAAESATDKASKSTTLPSNDGAGPPQPIFANFGAVFCLSFWALTIF